MEYVPRYELYEKPMTNNKVMEAKSAQSQNCKYTTLAQEMKRWMENTDRKTGREGRIQIGSRLAQKMHNPGYDKQHRKKIIEAGVRGYYNQLKRQLTETEEERKEKKRKKSIKKFSAKAQWFKQKKKKERIEKREKMKKLKK